jgi:uncharacterized protein (TIGR02598 family)
MMSSSHRLTFQSAASHLRAFSLVEVVIAVGVVAFAFVAILGLIPAGLTQFRQAIDTSVCAQIATRVIQDAQQTEFDTLVDYPNTKTQDPNYTFRAPLAGAPALRYFDEQGNELAAQGTNVVYQVNTRIGVALDTPGSADGADSRSTATVTVQVIFNPGNQTLTYVPSTTNPTGTTFPSRNLVDLSQTKGVTVKTYSALVSRNQ